MNYVLHKFSQCVFLGAVWFLSDRVVQNSVGGAKLQIRSEYPHITLNTLLYANVPPTTLNSGKKGIIYQHLTYTRLISMPLYIRNTIRDTWGITLGISISISEILMLEPKVVPWVSPKVNLTSIMYPGLLPADSLLIDLHFIPSVAPRTHFAD